MNDRKTTVNSRNVDGTIRRSWHCEMIEQRENLLIFVGVFDQDIAHSELGSIKNGTISYEYYWLDRWYNIFRFHESDGTFRNYYCNINMPPTFENGVLDYIDLDIDLVVWPDGSIQELDRDEYVKNSRKFNYSEELKDLAEEALSELKSLIDRGELPS